MSECEHGSVSKRARQLIKPPLGYIQHLVKALDNQYHPISNPKGAVLCAVAENKLCSQMLMEKLSVITRDAPPHLLNYTSTFGLPSFRTALSNFMADYLFDGTVVDPANLVVASGCVALLVSLSLLLFDEGDAVLIPAPYYPAFDNDFLNFANVKVLPVHGQHSSDSRPFGVLTMESLELGLAAADRPVKAILLTNPSNPLGTLYSEDELRTVIDFCRNHKLHLIMDDVYALSMLVENQANYVSVVNMLHNELGDYVHILWSFSKDIGASGFRVGVLYTQNKSLLAAMGSTNDAMMASNFTQYAMQQLIADRSFVDSYLKTNSERLRLSYDLLSNSLKNHHVRILPAQGAIFAFTDFSYYLDEPSFEAERRFFELLDSKGVLLTPGHSCHCLVPGYFRFCYAFVQIEGLQEGIRRIIDVLQGIEQGRLR